MLTPELLEFIRVQQEAGMSREEVERLLLTEGGWTKTDVDEAFRSLSQTKEQAVPPPVVVPVGSPVSQPQPTVAAPIIEPPTPTPVVSTEPLPVAVSSILPSVSSVDTGVAHAEQEQAASFIETTKASEPEVSQEAPAVVSPEVVTVEPEAPAPLVAPEPLATSPLVVKEEPHVFVGSEDRAPAVPVTFATVAMPAKEEVPAIVNDAGPVVSVPPSEDFLGIFGSVKPSSWSNHSADLTASAIPPSPLPFVEIEASAPKPQESLTREGIPGGVAAKTEGAEVEPAPSFALAPAAPSVPPAISVLRNAPSPFAQQYHTKEEEEPASVFKFDFAKMRSVPLDQKVIPVTEGSPTEAKTIDVSQLLKTETKDESSRMPVSAVAGAHETKKELSAPAGRRTMAGDILLQGLISPSPIGIAPVVPPPATPVPTPVPAALSVEDHPEKPQVTSASVSVFGAPLAEDIKRKNTVKRLLGLAIGGAILLAVLGGVVFMVIKFRAPDIQSIASSAFGKFFDATSFSYKGKSSADLLLSTAVGGAEQTGIVKFDLDHEGSLNSSPLGYGDGVHHIKLTGGLQSGDFSWPAYLDADMRISGSSLYFHLLSLPSETNLDPELIRSYWIKVNLSEVAKELAFSGIATAQEGYGDFGGQNKDSNFNAMLKKHAPFEASEQLSDEVINGVAVQHFRMKTNGEAMLQFTVDVYKRFFGKDLVLTDDKHIRLRDGLAKMVGEIWINKDTGELMQARVTGDLDDDMFDVHVRGKVDLFFEFFDLNKPVVVDASSPVLTLEELKAQMDQYQREKEVRSRDAEKLARLTGILSSLDAYKEAKGRFPTVLSELYGAGIIASSSIPELMLRQYEYEAYVERPPLLKVNRCTIKGKVCAFYHIGISLEDAENASLSTDSDITGDVRGADTAGCTGEKGFACYDVVTPVNNIPSAPSVASSTAVSSKLINGKTVPSCVIDETLNNSTIRGIDQDNNGIRDDIDCFLAKEFGLNNKLYALAETNAQTLQTVLVHNSEFTEAEKVKDSEGALVPIIVKAHIDSFRCITDVGTLEQIDRIDKTTLNTAPRKSAYSKAFAGAYISSDGCPAN